MYQISSESPKFCRYYQKHFGLFFSGHTVDLPLHSKMSAGKLCPMIETAYENESTVSVETAAIWRRDLHDARHHESLWQQPWSQVWEDRKWWWSRRTSSLSQYLHDSTREPERIVTNATWQNVLNVLLSTADCRVYHCSSGLTRSAPNWSAWLGFNSSVCWIICVMLWD